MTKPERQTNKEEKFKDPDMEMAIDLIARLFFDQILWEAKIKRKKPQDSQKEKVDQSTESD